MNWQFMIANCNQATASGLPNHVGARDNKNEKGMAHCIRVRDIRATLLFIDIEPKTQPSKGCRTRKEKREGNF
jgi:hypothetical protein